TIAVPPPADGNRDVLFFVHHVEVAGTPLLPPPPPPPLAGGPFSFGILASRGIRMVRPGEIATNEEIERIREAFGEGTEVQIDRAENGIVQRVSVLRRRMSDETDTVRPLVAAPAAEPTATTDRSH